MELVANCSAFVSLSYQIHVKVCDPIPLRGNRYLHMFPPLILLFIPALVKHSRIGSNWVNGV